MGQKMATEGRGWLPFRHQQRGEPSLARHYPDDDTTAHRDTVNVGAASPEIRVRMSLSPLVRQAERSRYGTGVRRGLTSGRALPPSPLQIYSQPLADQACVLRPFRVVEPGGHAKAAQVGAQVGLGRDVGQGAGLALGAGEDVAVGGDHQLGEGRGGELALQDEAQDGSQRCSI